MTFFYNVIVTTKLVEFRPAPKEQKCVESAVSNAITKRY